MSDFIRARSDEHKEEIFLEISAEKMLVFYNDLRSAFPQGNNFTPDVIAEV